MFTEMWKKFNNWNKQIKSLISQIQSFYLYVDDGFRVFFRAVGRVRMLDSGIREGARRHEREIDSAKAHASHEV